MPAVVPLAASLPPSVSAVTDVPVLDPGGVVDAQRDNLEEMDAFISSSSGSTLVLEWLSTPEGHRLLCDVSMSTPRPVIPRAATASLLQQLHGLSHPGGNAMLRDVRRRFVWRGMASQVKAFCRACLPCQRAKVCLLYTSPSPRDLSTSRMPSSA